MKLVGDTSVFLVFCMLVLFCSHAQDEPSQGSWGVPIPFDIVPVAVANLPDGNLITWSSQFPNTFVVEGDGMTYTELFNPFANNGLGEALGSTVSATDHDMFCPGINNLSDGRILSAGGTSSEKTSIYDWKTNTWEVASVMNIPRGYQGNVTLSDGAVFTLGGSWSGGSWGNRDAEVWRENSGWSRLPGIQASDLYSTNDFSKELEGLYRIDNHAWMWLAPDGSVFHAGPGEEMHWFDVSGIGSSQNAGRRADDTYSMKGTTVMFDIGKLLKVGGAESYNSGHEAKDGSYVIDINAGFGSTPTVVPVANALAYPRTMHNSTVLPNGEVLITGGLSESVLFSDIGARMTAEIYSPTTNLWRAAAGMQIPRTYHSVSILMADARVFVGGGGLCDATPGCENHFNAEIYSPPYLFTNNGQLANRPSINAPEKTDYNTTIRVTGTSNVQQFSLVRNSSATHSTNNEQRRVPLNFTMEDGAYHLQIPDENTVPPGYYMMFAIDSDGVPSVAEIIKIGPNYLLEEASLLVHLDFEETAGIILNNFTGLDNFTVVQRDDQGVTVPATEFQLGSSGIFGNAIELDGKFHNSNTILEADFSTNLATIADEITVSAWVFRNESSMVTQTSKPANVGVFAHDYPAIFAGFHNSLLKWSFGTSDGFVDCYAGYAPLNQWVHIAVTYDGEIAKLFSNGVEICTKAITGKIELRNDTSPNSKFTVSGFYEHRTNLPVVPYGNSSGITDELDGRLDDFRVYNQALSNFQIRTIYEDGLINGDASIPDCRENLIIPEYKVGNDGDWIEGTLISAPLGSEVFIRAKNYSQDYFITTPEYDGPTFSSHSSSDRLTSEGAYQIDTFVYAADNEERNNGLLDISNTGQYALTTANGCATIIEVKIARSNENCTSTLTPEYRLNGVWFSGVNDLTVNEGDELIFSMLPNDIDVQIELPNGRVVGDNYTIGSVNSLHAGTYVIFSSEGCVNYLNVGVNGSGINLPPEAVAQADVISGFHPLLVSFNGSNASSDDFGIESYTWNFGDDSSSNLANPEHTYLNPGVYTATLTVQDIEGLSHDSNITITVQNSIVDPICEGEIIPEYRLDGVWLSGANELSVAQGTEVLFSMLPNGIGLTVEFPDGSIFGDNHSLGAVHVSDSGLYILRSEEGCSTTILLTVGSDDDTNPDPEPDPDPICEGEIVPEYRLDGVWLSGANELSVAEGTEVLFSMLPNGIGLTVEFPDGSIYGDNHSLGAVDVQDSGLYILRSEEGCKTTITLSVMSYTMRSSSTTTKSDINWSRGFDIMNENQMIVSPNPASIELKVIFDSKFKTSKIEIYDTSGRRVELLEINHTLVQEYVIDLRRLAIGTYYLIAINQNGERIAKQIIVER